MGRDFQSILQVVWRTNNDRLLGGLSGNDSNCTHSRLPSITEYYEDVSPLQAWIIAGSTVAVAATCVVFILSLRHVLTKTPPPLRGATSYVLTIHPVAALAMYVSVVIPRAYYLMEALIQDFFVICLYQMFCLLVAYTKDEALCKRLRGAAVRLNSCPCCCLPSCQHFCTPVALTEKALLKLRIVVLQLPVFVWIMYLIFLVLWAEDEKLLDTVKLYIAPIELVSFLLAIWGTNMVARVLSKASSDVRATQKFLVLELTLLLPVMQSMTAHHVAKHFPCSAPFTPVFWSNLVVSVLTLLEVLALSLWAHSLYCHEATGFQCLHDEDYWPHMPADIPLGSNKSSSTV